MHADVQIDGKKYEVYLCPSEDFKKKNESKIALDAYEDLEVLPGESSMDFCIRMGWKDWMELFPRPFRKRYGK